MNGIVTSSGRVRAWALVLFALGLLLPAPACADVVILKDGFIIQGKVRRENQEVVDAVSNESFVVPRGFFYVDDGARRHFFPPAQIQQIDSMYIPVDDTVVSPRAIYFPKARRLPPVMEILETGDFSEKWDRNVKYRSLTSNVSVNQHLTVLNSYFARMDCTTNYRWNAYYLTRELGLDTVRTLLAKHPDFQEPPDLAPEARLGRRFRYYKFFLRAGWYDHAEQELDRILRDYPKEKVKVDAEREILRKLQTQLFHEKLTQAMAAGRYRWVHEHLGDLPEKYATPRMSTDLSTWRDKLNSNADKLKELGTQLTTWFGRLETTEDRDFFEEVFKALREELSFEILDRFETFLAQARQAERQLKMKGKADLTATEVLSLATTAWMLGNASAESKVATARKLWKARQLVLEYARARPNDRQALLTAYEAAKQTVSVDEMAQLIAFLPPVEADEQIGPAVMKRTAGNATYHLQLPLEYRHTRAYPVLIVLHQAGESARKMLDQWSELANQHGYILVAPEWQRQDKEGYGYSTREHAVVLDMLLDLRRHYQVDSDRVFLFGYGEGATMAFDVGLSHPDLFAGVLPMGSSPQWFSKLYWPNAQYLPFYVVGGDQVGEVAVRVREQFEKWVPHGYPVMYVQYKGRSNDWFKAELAPMIDWMNRKKRFFPLTQMGRFGTGNLGDMFQTMRPTDNHFYWLSSEKIDPRHFNGNPNWSPRIYPATVYARIDPSSNSISIYPQGYQQMTIWLARTGQIDFDKRVTVRVGIAVQLGNHKVTPKLKTLLDDFADRGDRQQLFVARIDLKL